MGLYRSSSVCNLCVSCVQAQRCRFLATRCAEGLPTFRRSFSSASPLRQDGTSTDNGSQRTGAPQHKTEEQGAMSRKLAEMTEEAMVEGGRSARKNMQEAGFSEELKRQMEERVKASAFKSENAGAFSIVNMPSSAGRGTQDIAAASPWWGTESVHDTALRMLDDAKKPMRVPYKIPQPTPINVNLKPTPKRPQSKGQRLASARDRSSTYALSQSTGLSEDERAAVRKELSTRFEAGARSLPMTIQGLNSLANERIEDAIARGQFKNLPRGKGVNVQTDHNANSAFIDTTEYFMNKIIQKQEIVPPWIEKQQELAREVDRFRQRLRAEWKRHAARLIASQGGSLQQQMRRAQAYAAAEARLASSKQMAAAFSSNTEDTRVDISFTQINHDGRITSKLAPSDPDSKSELPTASDPGPSGSAAVTPPLPHVSPLRDHDFFAIERSYHELQIKTINDLTRSYNLQSPRLAQKPYLSLERESNACYADVAPSLADEIYRRATERASNPVLSPRTTKDSGSLLDTLTSKQRVRVYDEDSSKGYGLKEFWRDLFGKKEQGRASR